MAVHRTKSSKQLFDQYLRIENLSEQLKDRYKAIGDFPAYYRTKDRLAHAEDKADEYEGNILKTKSYYNGHKKSRDLLRQGKLTEAVDAATKNDSRGYSRNTYMGLANG